MRTFNEIYTDWKAADDAWHAELVRLFGKRAPDIRYRPQGKGEPGTNLRRLHDAFDAGRVEMEAFHRRKRT